MTDGAGVLLVAQIGPANRHDSIMFTTLVDAVLPIRTPAGRRTRPRKLHADKAYDLARCRADLRQREIQARIARRGVEPADRLGRHQWVIERTFVWLKRYRRMAVCWERQPELHQAFVTLACCLRCLTRLPTGL